MVTFDIAPVSSSIIMVVGVGGGGGNAVNHMYKLGITDVSFMVCNTDRQALARSPIPNKVALGEQLTEGLGAGNKPEQGRAAALESIEQVKEKFIENNIKMVFVTAGMGGGTGTGAAPVIAQAAKEMGILTVAIVTIPFKTEGRRRITQAIQGIDEIRHNVDSLLVINNENIHEIYGELTLSDAFGKADDILATAAKSIAEIITLPSNVNVDFADVQTVMKNSGIALMGSARGSGESRALEVAEAAMSSPLLNHKDIRGAKNVLLNITSGSKEVTLTETYQVTQFVQERTRNNNETDLIWGAGIDESLGDDIQITVIATGFDMESIPGVREGYPELMSQTEGGGARRRRTEREVIPLEPEEAQAKPKQQTAMGNNDGTEEDFSVAFKGQEDTGDTFEPVIPQPVFERQPVYEPQPPVEPVFEGQNVEEQPIFEGSTEPTELAGLSEDDLVNIPAYVRRKMKIEPEAAPGGKVSRETLGGTRTKRDKGPDLFE